MFVWKDEEGEFADSVAEMQLENVQVLTMRKDCMFELRRQIEVDYADEDLLIYCPIRFEQPQDNWLLDVFLYSEEFQADYWSLMFAEMNIENARPVREYARSVSAFFAGKERRAKLASLREKYANERELQTGIFGVLCGTKTFGMAEIVRKALSCDLDEENPCIAAIEKFCGADAFWLAMEDNYGYAGKREADSLACHLLTTAAMNSADGEDGAGLSGNAAFMLPAFGLFMDWKRMDAEGLLNLCQRIEEKFDIERRLSHLNRDMLMRMSVFPAADRLLIEATLTSFADGRFSIDDTETLLRMRRDQTWAKEYAAYYDAVQALVQMQRFYLAYRNGFHFTQAGEAWSAYTGELYRMDAYYRAFCNAHNAALACGVMSLEDSLRTVSDAVERLYKNWYLAELNGVWTQLLAAQGLNSLKKEAKQSDFYKDNVASNDSRSYVIISDALRYETAQALAGQMTGKLNGNTQLRAMVGTLPGITPVGMAA
ncbi:MAG: BREX-1 system phosphatase PglZ type A, partial [Clostridia bacterium]|nr:BREX-1 system phosphatase PglZ type A [Clostridia bacterium]